MTTTTFPNQKETANSCHQLSDVNARTDQEANSIFAYPQNEGLFSTDADFPQTKETSLSQLHYSDPCDILAQTGFVPKVIEIPDEEFRKTVEDSLKGGHLDNPGQKGRIGVVSCSIGHRIDKDGTWRIIHK